MIVFRVHHICLAAAALAALSLAPLPPAQAAEPPGGADVTGQTLYLAPGGRLRYGEALTSRVYARVTAASLEIKGNGKCSAFNCPVIHNKVPVFARRARLTDVRPAGPVVVERTLRQGDDGEDVSAMQAALNKKGFNLTVDGKYGPTMTDAVTQFQQKAGLTPDGEIGAMTREKLKI
jgi:hypothetical protein